jgi:hypothetical protein
MRPFGEAGAEDERAQAVRVETSTVESANANPHVTVAVSGATRPVYSNKLLSRGFVRILGPVLEGTLEFVAPGRVGGAAS